MTAHFVLPWDIYQERPFYAGRSEQFQPGTITSFAAVHGSAARPGFHVVRLDDGELLALLDEGRSIACAVVYQPNFTFDGRTGWFRDPCRGWVFDMVGRSVFGPSPGLDRIAVAVRDGGVFIDPTAITPAVRGLPTGYGLQTGGTLRTPPLAQPRYE